jgi:hypothetical protein
MDRSKSIFQEEKTRYAGIYISIETCEDGTTHYWIMDDLGGEDHCAHYPTPAMIDSYRDLVASY